MQIRKALPSDVKRIKEIYENAKKFMRINGNMEQWTGNYPSIELINSDVNNGNCYVCEENGNVLGVFCLFDGPDKTYMKIYDGEWIDDGDYCVIHRIATDHNGKGIAKMCFDFGLSKKGVLRIDTHRDNIPMQKALSKNGFTKCGIIYLESGDERIAFCKIDKKH